jgi:hypothetical protein
MTLAHQIPMELISKILIMRPTHPTAKLIVEFREWILNDYYDEDGHASVKARGLTISTLPTEEYIDAWDVYNEEYSKTTPDEDVVDDFDDEDYSQGILLMALNSYNQ